jgi:glycosyltransferase involved in cell wall biosynthesis
MKLIATTRVKNELEIIEAFVRHHAQHFDKLIVLDDGSSDGTYQILHQLQSVYSDLVVLHQPTIGYMQNRHMTLLLRMAVDKFGADWIAPLDADEFIEPAEGLMLTQVLAGRQPAVYSLGWSNFVWSADLEKSDQRNPVLRQRFCLPTRSDHTKLLVHAEFVSATAELTLGNHLLVDNGRPLRTQPLDCVRLCHYPIRSIAQYASKISIGYLQHMATPDRSPGDLFHYTKPFQELVELGLHRISERMKQDSLCYAVKEAEKARAAGLTIEAPLNYLGGPLTMGQGEGSFTSNLLRYAEMVATEFANVKKREEFYRASTQNASRSRLSELGLEQLNAQNEAAELELLNSQKKAAEQAAQETERCLELELELLNTLEQEAEKSRRFSELELLKLLNSQKKVAEQTANQAQRCLELEVGLLNLHEQTAEKTQRMSELELDLLNSQKSAAEQVARQAQRFLELELALLNSQEQFQSRTFRFLTRVHIALIRAKILRPRG